MKVSNFHYEYFFFFFKKVKHTVRFQISRLIKKQQRHFYFHTNVFIIVVAKSFFLGGARTAPTHRRK